MGLLIDGQWHDQWYDTAASGGRFIRSESQFRHWITPDGSPGPGGEGGFKAEPGRYHLYVSLACPWAHRALIMRTLKGLEDMISVSIVHWLMREDGWTFAAGPGVIPDSLHNARFLHQVYTAAQPDYSGRVTVPILWDKERRTIVNNESSEIIRVLTGAFDRIGAKPGDYYPVNLRAEIDVMNARVYDGFNNGVYKAGFATSQAAYDEAVAGVFETLDWLEECLTHQRYLLGKQLTEADIRLFTSLVRFDEVYHGHFKCNRRRIVDYPNLWGFTREIFQLPGIAATVNMEHIKRHYYESHQTINPTGVVPIGPAPDFAASHGRGVL
ncbi:glutathionyl-hydroquinone reductase YqjG [Steroidobacter denitrificans]|uniref:Glutathionyl-hydroquinone reductase YqjG n=1 Tax=Steroidobacter denitrificans TaxID=465721 RepID=A0A127FEH5_STEDE|nr:glutathione S-transferase family protein [Steroidobacter denitrificans]AMN48315.1 glutathionyl-hydroquinone reductase YqjG [Steroidobacter denitrificans]